MRASPAMYIRLKVHLIYQGRTLTEYAASLGTSHSRLYSTLQTWETSHRVPTDPDSIRLIETVAKELGEAPVFPTVQVDD